MLTVKIPEHPIPAGVVARRAWIRLQLAERGLTLAKLARRSRCSYGSLRQAMVHRKPKAERVIAKAIGISPADIWPERYPDADLTTGRTRRIPSRGRTQ